MFDWLHYKLVQVFSILAAVRMVWGDNTNDRPEPRATAGGDGTDHSATGRQTSSFYSLLPGDGGLVWQDLSVATSTVEPSPSGPGRRGNRRIRKVIVQPQSFSIANGRVCGLLGASGAGKTSLFNALLAGTPPTAKKTGSLFLTSHRNGKSDADEESSHGSWNEEDERERSAEESAAYQGPTGLTRSGQVWVYHQYPLNGGEERTKETLVLEPLHRSQVAFLQQQDVFFERLTVRETLDLAAYLELPHLPLEERREMVQQLLDGLGLAHVSDHHIGNADNGDGDHAPHHHHGVGPSFPWVSKMMDSLSRLGDRGGRLSGGERRRLSVALELVTEKHVFMADEPTSGLDSALSFQVIKLIRELAISKHIPCLVSLHQPRSTIWNNLLDDCIIMAPGGRVCFAGATDEALLYFERVGFKIPSATNPAEFLVDLVSIDTENATQATLDEKRIQKLAVAFQDYQRKQGKEKKQQDAYKHNDFPKPTTSVLDIEEYDMFVEEGPRPFDWVPRLAALLRRSWRQNIRNAQVNWLRLIGSAGNAYLLAQIFPTLRVAGVLPSSIADRIALLSFGAINMCMMAYMKTVELFAKERPVVRREHIRHHYSPLEYLVAKALAELPLDACFAAVFTTGLKYFTSLRISWINLTAAFSLLTAAGASMGFAVGSWAPTEQMAVTAGLPLLVIFMVVGVINPSGVDSSKPKPFVVQLLKEFSPFAFAIEALALGEYPGMEFVKEQRRFGWFRKLRDLPRMGGLALVQNGDQVIDALGLQGKTFRESMVRLATLTAGNLILSWLGLLLRQHSSGGAIFGSRKSRIRRKRDREPMEDNVLGAGKRSGSNQASAQKTQSPPRARSRIRF